MTDYATPLTFCHFCYWHLLVPVFLLPVSYSPFLFYHVSCNTEKIGNTFFDSFFLHASVVFFFNILIRRVASSFYGVSLFFLLVWVCCGPVFFFLFQVVGSLIITNESHRVAKIKGLLYFLISLVELFGSFLRWGTVILRLRVNLMVGAVIFSLLPSSFPFECSSFFGLLFNFFYLTFFLSLCFYELMVAYFQACLFYYLIILYDGSNVAVACITSSLPTNVHPYPLYTV